MLERTAPPAATPASDLGPVEVSRPLTRILLSLGRTAAQQAALMQYLNDLQNPRSPNYHLWLTPEEFASRFTPPPENAQKTRDWLLAQGFQVQPAARGGQWIEFSGTVAQVDAAFHAQMHYFRRGGEKRIANAQNISLPAELAPLVRGIASLNNFGQPPSVQAAASVGAAAPPMQFPLAATPQLTSSGNVHQLAPGDFAAIYGLNPLLQSGINGTGISIAVISRTNIAVADVQAFRQIFNLPPNDPNIVLTGPDPGISNIGDEQEAELDVEWAGAAAPGATINMVIAGSTDVTDGNMLSAAYAVDSVVAPIISHSFSQCESALGPQGNAFYNALWQQAAAEGITVLVSAGDAGSGGCANSAASTPVTTGLAVNGVASTPFNIAVGGTQFQDLAQPATFWNPSNSSGFTSAKGYIPEAAWNESCDPSQAPGATNCLFNTFFSLMAGGGGASTVYPKPSWQTGTGVPADNARDLPDVALAAASGHDGYIFCSLGSCQTQTSNGQVQLQGASLTGGASAATAAMAGILALVEQKNGAFQGQANFILYRLAASHSCDSSSQTNPTAQTNCVFYDVTTGGNAVPCAGGSVNCSSSQAGTDGELSGYAAHAGYDLATGLGSVNAANLAAQWTSAAFSSAQVTLQASPVTAMHGSTIAVSGAVAPATGAGMPTGAVVLQTGSSLGDVLTLTNGAFSGSINDLPGGQYGLTARYSGDAMFAPATSPGVSLNITPENSTTVITAETQNGNGNLVPLPANGTAPFGLLVGVRITVTGASGHGIATGTVTLSDGNQTLGTFTLTTQGSAYFPTGGGFAFEFAQGAHALTATYSGDASFHASATAAPFNFSVGKSVPTIFVTANMPTVTAGQSVGLAATVGGPGNAIPTGTLQFTDNGANLGAPAVLTANGPLSTGPYSQASIFATLAAGDHTIGANYIAGSDPNYQNAVAATTFQAHVHVAAASGISTPIALTPASTTLGLGVKGAFTTTVTRSAGKPAPSGTVTLSNAAGSISVATPLMNGSAVISQSFPQAGPVQVYAVYSGDTTYAAATSGTSAVTVSQAPTTSSLAAPGTAHAGEQVSLVATVTSTATNAPLPGGMVQFFDSVNGGPPQPLGAPQALGAGNGHVALFTLRVAFAAGTHVLSFQCLGDNNYTGSASNMVTLTVGAPDFAVSAAPTSLIITAGSSGAASVSAVALGSFAGTIALACSSGLPAGAACSFAPPSLGSKAPTSVLTMSTLPASPGFAAPFDAPPVQPRLPFALPLAELVLALAGALLLAAVTRKIRPVRAFATSLMLAAAFAMGCGGGGSTSPPPGPTPSSVSLATSSVKVASGATVTLTATVTASQALSGTVQFADGASALGSPAAVTAGKATLQISTLSVGTHVLTARYSGDAQNLPSASNALNEVVTGQAIVQITGTSGSLSHSASLTVNIQ
jgi:hypothetical protein